MKNELTFSQRFSRAVLAAVIAAPILLPSSIEARVLSGGITERKTNRKITSMLKSARKNFDAGKMQPAIDAYWKILELDPNETAAYLELGEVYTTLRIYDRAIELLAPGLTVAEREMDRDTICYYYCILTQAHLGLNQTGEANKSLIKAAEAAPQNPMPRKILGDIYLANNRIANAYKAYKKAIELDPDYQPAKEKLGELTAKYGDQIPSQPGDKEAIRNKAEKLPPTRPAKTQQATTPQPAVKPAFQPRPAPVATNTAIAASEDIVPIALPGANQAKQVTASQSAAISNTENATTTERPRPIPVAQALAGSEANTTASPSENKPVPIPGNPSATTAAHVSATVSTQTPATAATAATVSVTLPAAATASSDVPAADAAQIEGHIDKLLAGTTEEKKAATEFFVSLQEKGLTEIEELLYDSDPEVRIIAIRLLPEFKAFGPRVKTMLNDAAEDPDPSVVEEINKALQSL